MSGTSSRSVLALVVATSLLVAGCSGSPRRASEVALKPCTVGQVAARCGQVEVPEDRTHPAGRRIALRVVVVPAQAKEHLADPVFYLAGFGGAATDQVTWATSTFWRLNQTRDLVFVDQRGTGGSRRLTCTGLTEELGMPPDPATVRAAVDRCLASVRPKGDPRHDTTPAFVDDLDHVRQVLGYDRINLYGGSYGVSSGLAFLQRHGDRVRTAVLDSGSLLDVGLWEQTPVHAQQAFDRLAQRCRLDQVCSRSYDPAADLALVVARLRAGPVTVAGSHVDLRAFLSAVVDDYLATPEGVVRLPADLHAAARGDWAAMVAQHRRAAAPESAEVQLQTLTLRCSDAWAAMDADRVRAQRTPFAALMLAQAAWQNSLCAVWPHDPGASGSVTTSVPVVFLNGGVDPVDPPANVAAAVRTMPNAVMVAVPDGGHGNVQRDCFTSEASTFVQFGVRADPQRWTACVAMSEVPGFPRTAR